MLHIDSVVFHFGERHVSGSRIALIGFFMSQPCRGRRYDSLMLPTKRPGHQNDPADMAFYNSDKMTLTQFVGIWIDVLYPATELARLCST